MKYVFLSKHTPLKVCYSVNMYKWLLRYLGRWFRKKNFGKLGLKIKIKLNALNKTGSE